MAGNIAGVQQWLWPHFKREMNDERGVCTSHRDLVVGSKQ